MTDTSLREKEKQPVKNYQAVSKKLYVEVTHHGQIAKLIILDGSLFWVVKNSKIQKQVLNDSC